MEPKPPELAPLLKVCSLLNDAGAHYLVVDGQAVILHGLVRTTEDVDILIEASETNALKVWEALSHLHDGAVRELKPLDLLDGVSKIADEVEADVSVQAWKVNYAAAVGTALEVTIDGVHIPYVGYEMLVASKQTCREKDQWDILQLRAIKERR